jgi:long-chain acyl-CoA synthetase
MRERSSVVSYLEDFQNLGEACAYVQRRGYRTERWSYHRVAEAALGFAQELAARDIGKGDRVMLWGANCAEWVAAFFGCAARGVVVVPMDDGASADFVRRVLRQVEARLVVCSQGHVHQIVAEGGSEIQIPALLLEDLAHLRTKERAADPQGLKPDASRSLYGTAGSRALPEAPHDATQETDAKASEPKVSVTSAGGDSIGREDIFEIVFTSGTTAEPRGVVITHGNVLANVAPLEQRILPYLKYERLVRPVRFLNLLPLSHVFGQFLGMFLPPLMGGTVVFQDDLKPSEVIGTIRRERVSVLVSVPRVLQSLQQKVERDLEDRGELEGFRRRFRLAEGKHFLWRWWMFRDVHRQFGWKFWSFISGGAALDGNTEEFWGRLGYAVIQGYGLTETTSLISVNHPFKLGKGSIGKVLPGREVKLAEDGEILVRGGAVAAGYWNKNGNGQVSDDGGWYRTGDIGGLDEAGNLYFKGRKKEVIVTPAGMNVYPEDLEAALRRQPEVKDCVVIGIERGGNAEPCAVVILRDDASLETPVERANQSLAEYQRILLSVKWPEDDFPRTSTQKPRRNLIREIAQARLLQPREDWGSTASSPLAELITQIAGRSVTAVRPESALDSDLGLSSLDRVELLGALEDRYHVDLSETSFSAARTVGDLEKMLRGESRERAEYHYPGWTLRWPATWLRFLAHYLLLRPAILVLGWPRIEGRENLRGWSGPLLVISNHMDDVDVGFVLTALPGRFRHRLATAAGGEALEALRTPPPGTNLFRRIFDRLEWALGVALLNVFPLPREAGFRQSFAYAGQAVDRGYSILVFPEGRHSVDGKMNPFRAGIGLLAQNLGIPVLPMKIAGLFEVKHAGRKVARPGEIQVRIGRPVKFPPEADAQRIARELQDAVEAL